VVTGCYHQPDTPETVPRRLEAGTEDEHSTLNKHFGRASFISHLAFKTQAGQPLNRSAITFPLSFLRRCKVENRLIVHRQRLPFSPFLSTSCFSTPPTAQIADPEERPAKEKEKAQRNNIEGYINSYIQKSKKGTNAGKKRSKW